MKNQKLKTKAQRTR